MRPLPLRNEDPPADEVVVVRAGVLDREDARRAARRARTETGILSLSVFAALGQSLDELCRDRDLVRYSQVRTSSFGRLRRAGFAVLPTFAEPHYDVVLADLEDDTMERLERCFETPGPNPGRRPLPSS